LKRNYSSRLVVLAVALWVLVLAAGAVWAGPVTIQTVPVGNVGNAADTTVLGSVSNAYSGADVNAKYGRDGDTPLPVAARNNHKDIAKLLLDKGADVNATDLNRMNMPLHIAAGCDITKLLLDRGANVNAKDWNGQTLLGKTRLDVWELHQLLIQNGGR